MNNNDNIINSCEFKKKSIDLNQECRKNTVKHALIFPEKLFEWFWMEWEMKIQQCAFSSFLTQSGVKTVNQGIIS